MVLVVTNQAGVARGYYDEAQIGRFHDALSARLASENARIDAFYHCPFHADAVVERYKHPDHPDRKPNPGMLLRAIKDWSIDVEQSFLVGDKESDVLAAQRAGVKGHLFAGGDLDEFLTQTVGVQ